MKKVLAIFCLIICLAAPAYAQDRYNFDCKDTKLTDTLYAVAYRAGKNVVVNGKLEGTVLMNLTNKTVEEALDVLAKAYNFNWVIDNNVIIISPSDTMTQTKRFSIQYANLEQLKKEIVSMNIPEKNVHINADYNTVSVDGTPYMLQKVQNRIIEMDAPIQQVMIMAQMIELDRSDALKVGFNYTLPSYDNSVTPFRAQFTVTSDANRAFGNGRILARPSITTLNAQEASLLMGDRVPVFSSTSAIDGSKTKTVTFEDVGVKIKATPFVNDPTTKTITLKLEPTISAITKWIKSDSETAPQISTREAKTTVRIKSGETAVIGGLIKEEDIKNLAGIPGLMKLPILGKLFQSTDKSKGQNEIFILVTPYLLDDDSNVEDLQNIIRNGKEVPKQEAKEAQPAAPLPTPSQPVPQPETPQAEKPIEENQINT